MKILIVDDTAQNALLLRSMLAAGGHEDFVVAATAMEAFDILRLEDEAACGAGEIGLVLMDIMMPEVDGITAVRRIRDCPALADLPIIMVTAYPDEENLQSAFAAGAWDFVSWPMTKVEILARVRSALSLKREMDRRKSRESELLKLTHELQETNLKLARSNELLQRISTVDSLTGVLNRRGFDEFFAKSWKQAARDKAPLTLLMIDIDYFKPFNDTYGHHKGDACLAEVGEMLRTSTLRPSDFVARYGGEEFIAVLPDTDLAGGEEIAVRIQDKMADKAIEHRASDLAEHLTVSIGVASAVPQPYTSPMKLVDCADRAMYRAKREGRNRYVLYDEARCGLDEGGRAQSS